MRSRVQTRQWRREPSTPPDRMEFDFRQTDSLEPWALGMFAANGLDLAHRGWSVEPGRDPA
jgi:hypothetical protein